MLHQKLVTTTSTNLIATEITIKWTHITSNFTVIVRSSVTIREFENLIHKQSKVISPHRVMYSNIILDELVFSMVSKLIFHTSLNSLSDLRQRVMYSNIIDIGHINNISNKK